MKQWILMIALIPALPAAAQVGVGGLTYRQGDLSCSVLKDSSYPPSGSGDAGGRSIPRPARTP